MPSAKAEVNMTEPKSNSLIARLPRVDRLRLLDRCTLVALPVDHVVQEPASSTRQVYFPVDSSIALVESLDGKPCLQVGMIGSEGMLGGEVALGVARAPLHAVVQGAGSAWRVRTADFRAELESSSALRRSVQRYLYVLMGQAAATAACVNFHLIGPRLASWMLMSQARAHSPSFHMTHEFLAHKMGVRRGGITTAAKLLQQQGLIAYSRGDVMILDRKGLIAASCGCFAKGQSNYARVLH